MNATLYLKKSEFFLSLFMRIFIARLGRIPKKVVLFALGAVSLTLTVQAQVTIGALEPADPHAILELKPAGNGRGLLLPGVQLDDVTSTTSFTNNTPLPQGLLVYNAGSSTLAKGLYFWTGSHWEATGYNWFYMPATVFDTDHTAKPAGNEKNLYAAYLAQFNVTHANMPHSADAPELNKQISIPGPTDFYYYVISYDTTVFTNIKIDANGLMTYDLLKDGDESTYMNIVFVLKR
jgi:hypothetical protein